MPIGTKIWGGGFHPVEPSTLRRPLQLPAVLLTRGLS
jgi:hypothetical protein